MTPELKSTFIRKARAVGWRCEIFSSLLGRTAYRHVTAELIEENIAAIRTHLNLLEAEAAAYKIESAAALERQKKEA